MRYIILIYFIFLSILFASEEKTFLKSIKGKKFHSVNYEEYLRGYEYFYDLLNNQKSSNQNFKIKEEKGKTFIIEKIKKGYGAYLINNKGKNFLQMPHCQFDRYTCDIGYKFFLENDFKGASFSTAHRYFNKQSDLSHLKYSYFTAFAKASAQYDKENLIIQIHGFGKTKVKDTDIIISSGSKTPSNSAKKIDKCFKNNGIKSKLYGLEVYKLGGTKNTTNKLLKQMKHKGFIHLELSLKTRKDLLKSKEFRKKVAKCLK